MDLAPPPLGATPAPDPLPGAPVAEDRILGGVAARLADRLDVDALWIRIAFVLLALVSGIGVLLYAALWLLFIAGSDRRWLRLAGGVLLVFGLPLLISSGVGRFHTGPLAVLVLLVGLAVALWQPRRSPTTARAPTIAAGANRPVGPHDVLVARPASPRWVRPPRRPSILGRLTLGTAVLAAAVGALIDQANGGRLHPEQWLGAATIVCGAGLLVGAVVGRARVLVVPTVLFATAGFIAGESARVGVRPTALAGNRFISVGSGTDSPSSVREHVVIGNVELQIDGTPDHQVLVDARAGLGDVRIYTAADVTLEVHALRGNVRIDGVGHETGTFAIGPAGPSAVIVTAAVGHGHIDIYRHRRLPVLPKPTIRPARGRLIPIADGVVMTDDGSIVLAAGEAVIGADDQVVAGNHTTENRITSIETSFGEYRLLPDGLLLTPFGDLLDLRALRQRNSTSSTTPTTAPVATTPPVPGG